MHALATALAGFGLGLSLIVAIGAQNAYVLRQGLLDEHVLPVVAVCVVSDAVLIVAGVGGLGLFLADSDTLLDVVRIVGALFLFGYAVVAARRALRPTTLVPTASAASTGLLVAVTTTLALTWLNPHVYLDTVLLLGSISHSYDEPWAFAAGAVAGSTVWFFALGFGARYLRPLFAKPFAWRILDGLIALMMVSIGISLLLSI